MRLVNDRAVQRSPRPLVVAPIKRMIDYRRFRNAPGVIPKIARQIVPGAADHIPKHLIRPIYLAGDRLRIGIDQQLRAIETHPALGIVGPINTKTVELPRPDVGQKDVPDLVCLFRHRDSNVFLGRVDIVEQAQVDGGGVLGKDREIHPVAEPGRPERIWIAQPDFYRRHKMSVFYPLRFWAWQWTKKFRASSRRSRVGTP